MKERGIIFSAPMVVALLDGRKTKTRRLINPQPTDPRPNEHWFWNGHFWTSAKEAILRCPHGVVGDKLWVKETWGVLEGIVCCEQDRPNITERGGDIELGPRYRRVVHRAGTQNFAWGMHGPPKWKSSLFMPRSGSRVTLEITSVRVERLQDITERDAQAEGVNVKATMAMALACEYPNYVTSFKFLWNSLYGGDAWDKNPWVWVLEFKKL